MRRVPRRRTFRAITRRAPWTWRETGRRGTCLTHQVDPVYYEPDATQPLEIGRFDHLLRLYRHHGASPASVWHDGGIRYHESEWEHIRDLGVEWLEYVNRQDGTASRIAFGIALRYGSWESTPRGYMWVVPSDHYTTVRL